MICANNKYHFNAKNMQDIMDSKLLEKVTTLTCKENSFFYYPFTLTHHFRKLSQALEMYTYKTPECVMQLLYSESKTSSKCKRVFKKRGCHGLQPIG